MENKTKFIDNSKRLINKRMWSGLKVFLRFSLSFVGDDKY